MTLSTPIKVSHHLLLCATSKKAVCCDVEVGQESWNKLKEVISKLGLENTSRTEGIVLRSKVDCLRVCRSGPILLVWPDGTWYGEVDASKIEEIVKGHIIAGKPIEKWVFKTTPLVLD